LIPVELLLVKWLVFRQKVSSLKLFITEKFDQQLKVFLHLDMQNK
jgi:hypothetical protein